MKLVYEKMHIAIVVAFALLISGCKEVVYSGLQETEANNMVAVLAASDIEASRSADNKGIYALKVESADVATAIVVLKSHGYPTQQFESLGDIFNAQGIIGTPFEQHVRYIHAMNQELSGTITNIAGVREAHVLVTSPVKGRYDREEPRARASVTINHDPGFNKEENIAQIKLLVAYAMTNLAYDDVAVAMFVADDPELATTKPTEPNSVSQLSVVPMPSRFLEWLAGGKLLIAIGLVGLFMLAIGVIVLHRSQPSRDWPDGRL